MNKIARWTVMLLIAVAVGIWYGMNESRIGIPEGVFFILFGIVIFAVCMLPVIYFTYFSKNTSRVEKFVMSFSNKPYYAILLDMVNGRIQEAERKIPQLRMEQMRLAFQINMDYEKHNLAALPRQIEKIKKPDARHYYWGLMAILEGDWNKVDACKEQMRNKVLQSVLDAEVSFRKGDLESARMHGDLAITSSAGLQRYILVKSLERQMKNESRISYF